MCDILSMFGPVGRLNSDESTLFLCRSPANFAPSKPVTNKHFSPCESKIPQDVVQTLAYKSFKPIHLLQNFSPLSFWCSPPSFYSLHGIESYPNMAPQTSIPVAANVLGTIGTVFWCVQLVPQVWYNWKQKRTDGLPGLMMFLWAICISPNTSLFLRL